MSVLTDLARKIVAYFQNREQLLLDDIATLKEELAAALANDAADAATIAEAQAAATAARTEADAAIAKATDLEALVTEDLAEDAELQEILSSVYIPEDTTTPEETPA